jgi:general secretion pathway protein H
MPEPDHPVPHPVIGGAACCRCCRSLRGPVIRDRLANRSRGFTLLEVMVVLVLIGIIFSFAVLSVGTDGRAELMERETRRLAALLDLAGEEAVLKGEEVAVRFEEDSYEFLVLTETGWVPLEGDDVLRTRMLPEGLYLKLELEDDPFKIGEKGNDNDDGDDETADKREDEGPPPQVFLLSSGEMTPFTATLWARESPHRYLLSASLLGEIEWEALRDEY